MRKQTLELFLIPLSVVFGLAFWVVNAALMGQGHVHSCEGAGFFKNMALGATFVAGVSTACTAFAMVLRRGYVPGRDALAGIDRKTVILPIILGLAVLSLAGILALPVVRRWPENESPDALLMYIISAISAGAGFALMGSVVGNLAGSVTLEARDLGRWIRLNLVLLVSVGIFWLFLMWAVLHLLWCQVDALLV